MSSVTTVTMSPPATMSSVTIIIIIIYFLPIFELYIFSQRLRCLILYFINFEETDNRKASLSAMAVSYPIDVFYPVIQKNFLLECQHMYKTVSSR